MKWRYSILIFAGIGCSAWGFLYRPFPLPGDDSVLDHRGLLRNKDLPVGLYITKRLLALRSGWAMVSLSQVAALPLCGRACFCVVFVLRREIIRLIWKKHEHQAHRRLYCGADGSDTLGGLIMTVNRGLQ